MDHIRWGMIGCGDVTEVKSGPGFQKSDRSSLIAVMRRSGELAADYARRHNVPKWYDDADQLINDPEVDAVYIATPPAFHKEYTLKCAQIGKPVYVEKPMALNTAESHEMIQACKEANVPLFVAYYRRSMPKFLKIKKLLDSGIIGDIRYVTIRNTTPAIEISVETELPWRVIPEISGGGLFMDIGCHSLDLLDFLLGPIRHANGHIGNQAGLYKAEDIVSASFVFESGVQGSGSWCFTAFEHVDLTEIVGSTGKISFSTFGTDPVVWTSVNGKTEYPVETPQHVQQPLIQSIVNELLGTGTCPSHGESAARTSWVMDQIMS
ncbi:MAG: Gfo/Idh/MocA family oxidoreductase [Paenibacillaceae bacterium]